MVRAALAPSKRFGNAPRPFALFVPVASVVAASLLSALPIVSTSGWFPDFGYLALISWRLLRADPWPAWWAAPLGLVKFFLRYLLVQFQSVRPIQKRPEKSR